MKKKWALLISRCLRIASEVREGLGIVRRDVKPENILVAKGEPVKYLDFGYRKTLRSIRAKQVEMTQAAKKRAGS